MAHIAIILACLPLVASTACNMATAATVIPDPLIDAPLAAAKSEKTAVVAGGCFWGIQAVYEHVKGVVSATAGYSGGSAETANYEMVCTDRTGHAESVSIVYDSSQISYGQLLKIFFSVAHDPTQLNRQGPDVGTQYRSVIFYADLEQQHIAQAYIHQLDNAGVFSAPIVTAVVQLDKFYPAEEYHQDYATRHPYDPYIVANDLPKVAHLRNQFPRLYLER